MEGRQDGRTALSMASENGHLDVVKLLLGSEGINVNQARNVGATALLIASIKDHSDVVKPLLGTEGTTVM